ncbi:MAG: type II toxin-antitoxin system RelE/ParE family toxin [Immundisolibacterales bacterium]|nr:type II toxin-antitoxin system RelE/ParE family toxin [Immundisolibacterales bacterium]
MRRYRVIVTPSAQDDIREAHKWIAAENPGYARTSLDGLREKILGLETLPESHALAPESGAFDRDIRQLLYGRGTPWRIFLAIDGSTVQVLHARHGRRDYWRP